MSRAFSGLFDCMEVGVDANRIAKFNEYSGTKKSVDFYSTVYKFQRRAVLDWNATADNITMLFNMGFVGIREDSAAGAS